MSSMFFILCFSCFNQVQKHVLSAFFRICFNNYGLSYIDSVNGMADLHACAGYVSTATKRRVSQLYTVNPLSVAVSEALVDSIATVDKSRSVYRLYQSLSGPSKVSVVT